MSIFRKSVVLLLVLLAGLFIFQLVLLAYFDRPASDDYQFIGILKQSGFSGSIQHYYQNWSFRWVGLLYFNAVFSIFENFSDYPKAIFIYYCISFLLLFTGVFALLKQIISIFYSELPPGIILWSMSVLFTCSVYLTTVHAVEVWFWILASFIYLQPFIFTCIGAYFILSKKKSVLLYILLFVVFLCAGGGVENFALMVLLLLASGIVFMKVIKFTDKNIFRKTIIALAAVVISLSVNVTNPGAAKRKKIEINHSTVEKEAFTRSGIYKFATVYGKKKLIGVLLAPWCWLGLYMQSKKRRKLEIDKFSSLRIWTIGLITVFIICIVSILPLLYTFNSLGPERCLFPLTLILTTFLCFFFFYAGNKIIAHRCFEIVVCIALFIVSGSFVITITDAYKILSIYSTAYDSRTRLILQNANTSCPDFILDPLPSPEPYLITGDIMVNTQYYPQALGVKGVYKINR